MIPGMTTQESRPARILVLYQTTTGNTKLMADLVVEGALAVRDTDVRLRSVEDAGPDDLLWCDGIAVGSPTCMGTISWQMKRFWDEIALPVWPKIEGKFGCAFSSAGGLAGGGESTCLHLLIVLMNFGLFTFGIPDYVAPGRTLHYGAVCAGRPRDEGDRDACRRLGTRLAEWVQSMILGRPELGPQSATYDRRT